jgi:DNA-binding MarR family transcriptional regulator
LASEKVTEQAREIHTSVRALQQYMGRCFHGELRTRTDEAMPELTLPQFNTLKTLHEKGGLTIKELAEELHVSAPSASAMADRLVDMHLLSREHCESDRRAVRVCLTPEAEDNINIFTAFFLQSLIRLLEKLGPEMSAQWCEIYKRIRAILAEEEAGAAWAEK